MHTRPSNQLARRIQAFELENRWCPACLIVQDDETLRIIGDNGANTVTVTHDGAGNVAVTCDEETMTAEGVERIVIDTRGGDDNVTVNVTGELTTELDLRLNTGAGNDRVDANFLGPINEDLRVRADLGAGDDTFQDVNIDQEIRAGAEVRLDVRGRDGNDTWSLSANEVREDAELRARFHGGDGDDTWNVFLGDPIDEGAEVKIDGRGGDGDDTLRVDATTFGTGADIGADAELQIRLDGGNGNDTLFASYEGVVEGELKLRLDGGRGDDAAEANVTVSAGSTGEAQARVNGDGGDDNLTLLLNDLSGGGTTGDDEDDDDEDDDDGDDDDEDDDDGNGQGAEVRGRIDGGRGFDTCTSTPNVEERNCEV